MTSREKRPQAVFRLNFVGGRVAPGHAYDPVQMVKLGTLLGSCVWFTKPGWGAGGMTSLLNKTLKPQDAGKGQERRWTVCPALNGALMSPPRPDGVWARSVYFWVAWKADSARRGAGCFEGLRQRQERRVDQSGRTRSRNPWNPLGLKPGIDPKP